MFYAAKMFGRMRIMRMPQLPRHRQSHLDCLCHLRRPHYAFICLQMDFAVDAFEVGISCHVHLICKRFLFVFI